MASISASIELYDRVSAPINRMLGAMGNMINAFDDIQSSMDSSFDSSHIEQARRATEQAALEMVQLGNHIEDNTHEQNNFNRSVRDGTGSMNGLLGKVMGMVGAYASVRGLGNVLNISDELVQTTSRIGMMNEHFNKVNKTATETNDLVKLIYNSAQDARGSFSDMADVVARFGNNARDAFSNQEEVVAFTNLVQKQMTIAGAGTQEASNAMLQLSQALGSGVLRGDELNSIFEQAPNLIQSIADYMGKPIGKIREMAQDGELTADVVKAAIFASADDINAKFEEMPMTWGQTWTKMKNSALMKFQPVLNKINELANSPKFQNFVTNVTNGFATISSVLVEVIDGAASFVNFVADNWSIISPIIYGIVAALMVYAAYLGIVKIIEIASAIAKGLHAAATTLFTKTTWAATTAQMSLNGAMYACPIVWIIILVIALIAVIVLVCNWIAEATGMTESGLGIICGALAAAGAVIGNIFIALINFVIDIFVVLWNFIAVFVNFFANVFTDPVGAIARLFFDLVDVILELLQTLASAIDTIFGSNLAGAVQGWRDDLGGWVDDTFGKGEEVMAKVTGEQWHVERFDYGEAWDAGTKFGDGLADKISDFDPLGKFNELTNPDNFDAGQVPTNIANTANNTEKSADALEITSEDLKYLRDIAETEVINRFTTAEIKVEMTNNNNINNDMDLDGVVDYLANGVSQAMEIAAEGVH